LSAHALARINDHAKVLNLIVRKTERRRRTGPIAESSAWHARTRIESEVGGTE
jgi:hypothetical protein